MDQSGFLALDCILLRHFFLENFSPKNDWISSNLPFSAPIQILENRRLYSWLLSCPAFQWRWGWRVTLFWKKPPCFCYVKDAVLMLISWNLHKKSSEVSIKTRSFSFKGQPSTHNCKMAYCTLMVAIFIQVEVTKRLELKMEFDLKVEFLIRTLVVRGL